jgi:hypothetical protein
MLWFKESATNADMRQNKDWPYFGLGCQARIRASWRAVYVSLMRTKRLSNHSMVADVSTEGVNGSFIWKQRGGNEFARHNAHN